MCHNKSRYQSTSLLYKCGKEAVRRLARALRCHQPLRKGWRDTPELLYTTGGSLPVTDRNDSEPISFPLRVRVCPAASLRSGRESDSESQEKSLAKVPRESAAPRRTREHTDGSQHSDSARLRRQWQRASDGSVTLHQHSPEQSRWLHDCDLQVHHTLSAAPARAATV